MRLEDITGKNSKEIINETAEELHPYYARSLNGALTFNTMDQFYELYRFSILSASADARGGFAVKPQHVLRDHPMTIGYSKEEQQMILDTAKLMGKEITELTDHGSNEPEDTGMNSPVAVRREIWDLWKDTGPSKECEPPRIMQTKYDTDERVAHDIERLSHKSTDLQQLGEDWKEKAGALATAACLVGTPGCATTSTTGPGDLIPTLNAIDRVTRFSNAGMKELGAQELKDLARGDKNNSVILRMLKQAEAEERQGLSYSYAIYNNGVPTVKYSSYEYAERVLGELESKFPEYKFEIRRISNNRPVTEKSRRASRAVKESSMMPTHHSRPIKGGTIYPDMDQYYELYRFSLAMAQSGEDSPTLDPRKDLADAPMTLAYTDADAKIIAQAAKRMGKKGAKLTTSKSQELVDTNKKSPVAQRKELKDLYK